MKRLFLTMVLLATVICGGNLYAQNQKELTKEEKKELKKQKKEREKAIEAKVDAAKFQMAVNALDKKNFVLEADRAEFKYGDIINVSSTTNFVAVSGDKATVQLSVSGHVIGPNGLGGVTVDGYISGWEMKTDKKGNVNCSFNVMGSAISALIEIMVPNGDNYATVYITPNYNSNRMKFYGVLLPTANSTIFKGFAW
ncbi:MAG: DUF4251 domain-containing protein [Bacteroidia bacterium]|nr:DUF4251 domain-containing protein [Bacteroidia bacterium]